MKGFIPLVAGALLVASPGARAEGAGAGEPQPGPAEPAVAAEPVADETAEPTADAPESTAEAPAQAPAEPETTLADVVLLLQQQQATLDAQRRELEAQRRLMEAQDLKIATLTKELDALQQTGAALAAEQVSMADPDIETESAPQVGESDETVTIDATKEAEEAAETGEAVAEAQRDDPTRVLLEEFPGAWRLPGTDAALSVGGFVKTAVVYNFDPLDIQDRFIVGSIPVSKTATSDAEAQSSITADQSRLNFDLREPTEFGILRAFIEGDFAEENDTFRLRHAFGQWNKILAGKTWSAFVDTQASPEEVDFEGLNGRVNVRQSQIRVMPTVGREYEFQVSMEDPNPQVQNGQGVTRAPDFVFTGRFSPRPDLQTKAALLARQIRAQRPLEAGAGVEKKYAWGLSLSGRYRTPQFDDRDSLLFQVNYGDGIGRYVNDLSSVGSFDGIFNPNNGDLELFDIFAGYVSWQHWWGNDWWGVRWLGRNRMRSNFTLGYVNVDNPGFVEGDAYKQTIRFSTNLFWSPTPRIDIGGEYLWGARENQDGSDGDARQIQMSVRYRF